MRRFVREERGEFNLTSLLVGMVLMGIVVGATLMAFESFVVVDTQTVARNEVQDRARTTLDAMAKELRNLASPTPEQPQAVDLASSRDLVFKTVNPNGPNNGLNATNVMRVRYCVDAADPVNGKLWQQTQTWTSQAPPGVPSTGTCPGSGWTTQRLAADRLVNGSERPVFTVNAAALTDISALHVELVLDDTPGRAPAETRMTTGVFLRNQNRRPTAQFSATRTAQGIVLNGSGSTDPEGQQLRYVWFDGETKVGEGIVFTYPAVAGTTHTMTLRVFDPATLEGIAPSQVVTA